MHAVAKKRTLADPSIQLRALYMALLRSQNRFDEFKHLLALYHPNGVDLSGAETQEAAELRRRLNDQIEQWVGMEIDALEPMQVLQWRAIVVEGRYGEPTMEHSFSGD